MADYAARLSQHMKILIFSGTTEGRKLSRALAQQGVPVQVCVATEYGKVDQGECPGVEVHSGRLEPSQMAAMMDTGTLCIDATHPYAVAVTANIRAAAAQSGAVYQRLLRPASALPEDCLPVADAVQAVDLLQKTRGNILLTTGAKELCSFAPLGTRRLYARVLPLESSLQACREAGIPPAQIIAMQGPFSVELNVALLRQFSIRYMVTKDGGTPGGFTEKLQAARACGTRVVVLQRPVEQGASYEEVWQFCKEWMARCR